MAKPDSWMPFYWGDFWRDTGHLTPAEGWAYINLIGAYWIQGKPLEANEERLQRLAKVTSLSEWERVRKTVLAFFELTVTEDGHCYSHRRIDRELAKAKKAYASRVEHMNKLNAKRKAKQSLPPLTDTVTATVTVETPQSLPTVTVTQPQPQQGSKTPPSEDADASLKERLFGSCLAWLIGKTQLKRQPAAAIIGKWIRDHGEAEVLRAFNVASRESPPDPVAYMTRVLKPKAGKPDAKQNASAQLAALAGSLGAGTLATSEPEPLGEGRTIDADCRVVGATSAGDEGGLRLGHGGVDPVRISVRHPVSGADLSLRDIPGTAPAPASRPSAQSGFADQTDVGVAQCDADARGPVEHGQGGLREKAAAAGPGSSRAAEGAGGVGAEKRHQARAVGRTAEKPGEDYEPDVGPMPEFLRRRA